MRIFFGAAIQGASNREERAAVHRLLIDALNANGCEVISEHTTGKDYDATVGLLQDKLGPLPPKGMERTILIRNKMIEFIEGDRLMKQITGNTLKTISTLVILFLMIISSGVTSSEAADSKATFTVQ